MIPHDRGLVYAIWHNVGALQVRCHIETAGMHSICSASMSQQGFFGGSCGPGMHGLVSSTFWICDEGAQNPVNLNILYLVCMPICKKSVHACAHAPSMRQSHPLADTSFRFQLSQYFQLPAQVLPLSKLTPQNC